MSIRNRHLCYLALGAFAFTALPETAQALPRQPIEDIEPIEIERPPPRPVITERIRVDPDVEAFPESGVQHPATLPVFNAPLVASSYDSQKNVERSFGNSTWGGGYRQYSHVRALSPQYQSINFETNAWGKLFGKRIEAFKLTAATWNPRDDYRSSRVEAHIGGSQVCYQFQESTALIGSTVASCVKSNVDYKLIGADKTFTVGPVPITVKGEVRAKAGAGMTARAYRNSAISSGVSLNGSALADVYGRLSASVGVSGFSAGVRGSVSLVKINPVVDIRIDRNGNAASYKNAFNVNISSLDGYVEVFAELLWKEWSKVILDWNGYSFNYVVSNESGTVSFGPALPIFTADLATLALAP